MADDLTVIARVLEVEFGSFLAHDPHDPARFYQGAAEAVRAALGETTSIEYDERFSRETQQHVLVQRTVTPWVEVPRG